MASWKWKILLRVYLKWSIGEQYKLDG
jgi:hypothetical protein